MDITYKAFFGLKEEPFRSDLKLNNILQTENLKAVKTRFDYTVRVGGAAVVTGEIGSGKTTALRYASEVLHPSEYRVIYITATSGPILELYRQICTELAIGPVSRSKAAMTGCCSDVNNFVLWRVQDLRGVYQGGCFYYPV